MAVASDHIGAVLGHRFFTQRSKSTQGAIFQLLPVFPDGNKWQCDRLFARASTKERIMPVLLLWAVPAVIVIGGAGYWLVHLH
jgi:hypothetical protein